MSKYDRLRQANRLLRSTQQTDTGSGKDTTRPINGRSDRGNNTHGRFENRTPWTGYSSNGGSSKYSNDRHNARHNARSYDEGSKRLSNGTTAYKTPNPDQHKAGRDGISITQRMKGSTTNGGHARENYDAEERLQTAHGYVRRHRNPTGRPAEATTRGKVDKKK